MELGIQLTQPFTGYSGFSIVISDPRNNAFLVRRGYSVINGRGGSEYDGYNDIGKGVYSNLLTQFMSAMLKGERPVIYGDGEQRRDFVFVSDVVDALQKASSAKGFNVYNVGTGKS